MKWFVMFGVWSFRGLGFSAVSKKKNPTKEEFFVGSSEGLDLGDTLSKEWVFFILFFFQFVFETSDQL